MSPFFFNLVLGLETLASLLFDAFALLFFLRPINGEGYPPAST